MRKPRRSGAFAMEGAMGEAEEAAAGLVQIAKALTAAIETSAKGYEETHEEIERARETDWKTPDGKPWKFSWEK